MDDETTQDQQELHDLAELYAVGALTPEEDTAFAAHLSTCPDCSELVREYREGLAELVPEELPVQESIRADVMARIRELPQVPRAEPETATETATTTTTGSVTETAAGSVPDPRGASPRPSSVDALPPTDIRRPARRSRPIRAFALGAAFALAACLGIFAIAERPWEGPDEAERVGSIVAAPDARTFREASADGQGMLTVVVAPSQGTAVLTAEDLPSTTAGQVYQAWWFDAGGTPVSAGVLTSSTGARSVTVLSGSVDGAVAVAVTAEPDGGSTAPTSDPIGVVPVG